MTTHLVIRPPPTECFLPANYTFFQEPVTLGSVTPAAGCRICEPRIWRADRITNLITATARWPTWFCRVVKKKTSQPWQKTLNRCVNHQFVHFAVTVKQSNRPTNA